MADIINIYLLSLGILQYQAMHEHERIGVEKFIELIQTQQEQHVTKKNYSKPLDTVNSQGLHQGSPPLSWKKFKVSNTPSRLDIIAGLCTFPCQS